MRPCRSAGAQGTRGTTTRCTRRCTVPMRCVQPGSRRVAGADGTNGPATSAGAGVCPVQNRPSRRATAEDPELALPHWHTPPPLHRTVGARREGGRLRVAVVDSATPPGRPTAAAKAQVAVEHGARRRAPSKPPPLPAAQHVSSRADSPTGQEACRSCAAPSCGQCGTSTSYVYLERRGGESARARVGHTTPHTAAARGTPLISISGSTRTSAAGVF